MPTYQWLEITKVIFNLLYGFIVDKLCSLSFLDIFSLYAMKVMSDGQLSKEEYKIIDTLEIF